MLRNVAWLVVGLLGTAVFTSLGTRLSFGHVIPDFAVIVIAFLAMRREPMSLVFTAVLLGYIVGRFAVAPPGVHPAALAICAVGLYLLAGHLAGEGAAYFGFISGVAVIGYHATLYFLLETGRDNAGFASVSATILVPAAMLTALVAAFCHRPMSWLEKKLSPERHEGLSWR